MPSFMRSLERIFVTSWPASRMRPSRASIRPTRVFRNVVLPAPLVPSSSTVSPGRMSRSTAQSTCMVPWRALTPLSCISDVSGAMLASQKHFDDLRHLDGDRELSFEYFLAGVHHDDTVGD